MNEPIDFLSFPVDDIDQLERGCRSSGEVPRFILIFKKRTDESFPSQKYFHLHLIDVL